MLTRKAIGYLFLKIYINQKILDGIDLKRLNHKESMEGLEEIHSHILH